MGFFLEFSGFKSASFAAERKDEGVIGNPKVSPTAQSDGPDSRARIDRKQLETLYLTDPQTLNTIDLYATIPIQAGYRIQSINKTNQRQYDEFFANIGKYGLVVGSKQLLTRLLTDTPLYGYAYVERIFGIDDFNKVRIVDLKPVDAKLMDYARDTDGIIVVDEFQKPVGYTMNVGINSQVRGDPTPKRVNLDIGKVFLQEERIACFHFKSYGNGFESIGVVEAAALDIERKQKIKTAMANEIYNNAAYKVYAIVGDAQRSASKKVQEDTLTALQNLSYSRFGVFQYPTQLNTLKVEHSPQAEEFLRFERSEQATSGGIALGIAVGSGEAINRQTMGEQLGVLDMKFDGWIERFCEQFNQKILDYIYKYNEYGSKAELKWNDVSLEDKTSKANTLLSAIDKKVVSPEEVRKFILTAYDIEENKSAYQEFLNAAIEEQNKQLEASKNNEKLDKKPSSKKTSSKDE
jgi:hypothetical protein